jgi:hypothetical protein
MLWSVILPQMEVCGVEQTLGISMMASECQRFQSQLTCLCKLPSLVTRGRQGQICMNPFNALGRRVLSSPLCPGEVLRLGAGKWTATTTAGAAATRTTPAEPENGVCYGAGEETVHREMTGAKRTAPVAQSLRECEGIGRDVPDHPFVVASREQGGAQSQQQVAAFRQVIRVHEILHHQGTLQLKCCLAVGKHLDRTFGSRLAVLDRFCQVQ